MNGSKGIPFIFPTKIDGTEFRKRQNATSNMTNITSTFIFGRICDEPSLLYILIGLNITLILVGAINNCLVALVVWRTKSMQNPTNLLLSNNAIAEVIYLIASGSDLIIQILLRGKVFTLSKVSVVLILDTRGPIRMIIIAPYFVAAMNLALLAIERFNALCNPMKTRRRLGKRSAKLSIVIMWLVAVLSVLPLTVIVKSTRGESYIDLKNETFFCTFSATIPTIAGCTIMYCYGRIIYGIYISKSILNQSCSATTPEDITAKKNIVKMLLSITLAFVVAKFPITAYVTVFNDMKPQTECLGGFLVTLAHVSAFLNPIIYLVFSSNYREGARRLLKSCFHNRVARQDESNNTSNLHT